jgi:predicted AAA+ superfamily ATPase
MSLFQTFIKLCAGRIGQLLNINSLANDCGISAVTAESWISLLEMSYILFRAQPHHKNFSKRIVKTSKIYFYDTGLACSLLEIDDPKQLAMHYLRGGLFESFVFSEILKMQYNKGLTPHPYFWRDKTGHEVDCIIERGGKLHAIEMKAGKTINNDFFTALTYWKEMALSDAGTSYLVYAGDESQDRTIAHVLKWNDIDKIMKIFE